MSAAGGPGIQGFGRGDGKAGPVVKLPEVFGKARVNLSLESLTFESQAGRFWTANEEALTVDGPVAGSKEGTLVRLQEISKEGRMLRQVAWRTECAGMRFRGAGNGVSMGAGAGWPRGGRKAATGSSRGADGVVKLGVMGH